jgi:hypothetical protein
LTTIASDAASDIGGSISQYSQAVLIDRFLPEYDWNEVHSVEVAAAPAAVLAALRAVTAGEMRLVGLLMRLRAVPARLLGHRRPARDDGPVLAAILRSTFVLLAESESEMVVGTIGRSGSLARPMPRSATATPSSPSMLPAGPRRP